MKAVALGLFALAGSGLAAQTFSFQKEYADGDRSVVIFATNEDGYSGTEYIFSNNGLPYFRRNQVKTFTDGDRANPTFSSRVGVLKLVEYNSTVDPQSSSSFCELTLAEGSSYNDTWIHADLVNISQDSSIETFKYTMVYSGKGACEGLIVIFDAVVTTAETKIDDTTYSPNEINVKTTVLNFPYKMSVSKLAFAHVVESSTTQAVVSDPLAVLFQTAGNSYLIGSGACTADDNSTTPSLFKNQLFPPPAAGDSGWKSKGDDGAISSEKSSVVYIALDDVYVPAKIEYISVIGEPRLEKNDTANTLTSAGGHRVSSSSVVVFVAAFVSFFVVLL